MKAKKVALIIVFNHRYDKNIEVLKEIYANRFTHLFFLMPFYNGNDKSVIAVYENSFYFQGYLAQGFQQYFSEDFEQYLFVADDMIINPAINENNYADYLGINVTDNYLPQVFNLHKLDNSHTFNFIEFKTLGKPFNHWHPARSVLKFSLNKPAVECSNQLPDIEEAKRLLQKQGYPVQPLPFKDVVDNIHWDASAVYIMKRIVRLSMRIHEWNKKFELPYPVVAGYSDMAVVNKDTIHKFIQYCGAFAALNLWVEIALPTALLLASSNKVVTEVETGKRGILYWNENPEAVKKYQRDMESYNYRLSDLFKDFPKDKLYIHPIKLSKWGK